MKPVWHERIFAARMTKLDDVEAFIAQRCRKAGVAEDDRLRAQLVVEEWFTNTVQHGHGGDCERPLRIGLRIDAHTLQLRFADDAPAFDPLAHARDAALAADMPDDLRAPGGWGVQLMLQLAADIRYTREGRYNRLWLELRRQTG